MSSLHMQKVIEQLDRMKHSPVRNYAIPGLTSWVIGEPTKHGMVRLFECERQHQEPIVPHSHRFGFTCQVLQGSVCNVIWTPSAQDNGDLYQLSELEYCGETGKYKGTNNLKRDYYTSLRQHHTAGSVYSMTADQIHSIFFDRKTKVLFFEGPTESNTSLILQPMVNGEVIPTFKVEDWMFRKPQKG